MDQITSQTEESPTSINLLACQYETQIKTLHDFYTHTLLFYQFFEENHQLKAGSYFMSEMSGSGFRTKELLDVAKGYKDHYLTSVVFQQLTNALEHFLADVLTDHFRRHPAALSGNKSIKTKLLKKVSGMSGLLDLMIRNELHDLLYGGLKDLFLYFKNNLGVSVDETTVETLIEIKATRDVIVHNKGQINDIYLDKTDGFSRGKLGDLVSLNASYIESSFKAVLSAVDCLGKQIHGKISDASWIDRSALPITPLPGFILKSRPMPRKFQGTPEEILNQLRQIASDALRSDGCELSHLSYASAKCLWVGVTEPDRMDGFTAKYICMWADANGLEVYWITLQTAPTVIEE